VLTPQTDTETELPRNFVDQSLLGG